MKVYKCDFCNKIKTCKHKDIEGKEYDVCAACWSGIENKLKGKGRDLPVPYVPTPWVPYYPPQRWLPAYPETYPWTITWGDTTHNFRSDTTGTYKLTAGDSTNALDITPN